MAQGVRVHYWKLASHLRGLPLSATCADLRGRLHGYTGYGPEFRDWLLAGLADLAPETEWLVGLMRLCERLREDNARFAPALFMEMTLEGK